MASKKKQSEGIALLSMYNDDDGDDEMEDSEEEGDVNEDTGIPREVQQQLEEEDAGEEARFAAAEAEADDAEPGESDQDEQKSTGQFLPPPPDAKCSEELQRKINKFLEYKKAGRSFNAEVRKRKDYRNPDFLLHAVSYQGIDQIGSCFITDVFNPHGYDSSDFYDEIEADMRREGERKEQEKKKAQKVDFIQGGTQPGIVAFGGSAVTAHSVLPPMAADSSNRDGRQNKKSKWESDSTNRDGRQNKKSKWDKV